MRTRILADLDTRWQAPHEPTPHHLWCTTDHAARMLRMSARAVRYLVDTEELQPQWTIDGQRVMLFRERDVTRLLLNRAKRLPGVARASLKLVPMLPLTEARQLSLFGRAKLIA
jgi:hypothetical protein